MSTEVKVPAFPESVTDGTVVTWHKQAGDSVRRGDTLVDIETDKVVFEVPAPDDGVLQEVLIPAGAVVVSGQVLARLGAAQVAGMAATTHKPAAATAAATVSAAMEVKAMPAARKMIDEHGINAANIPGSGKDGRVLKEDVLRFLETQPASAPARAVSTLAAPAAAAKTPSAPPAASGGRTEKRVPMTRLRARVAERLVQAQHTAAMLTTFNEINMQPVMDLRAHYRDQFEKEYGVRLGFMSFFVKASVEALKRFPVVNASVDGADIVYHGYFDIGIAVSSPRGLVVPVLRDAEQMSMAQIEANIHALSQKAQNGTLAMEDITGGTFSITNGGVFGSLLSTPILNPPQSAILGMHKIQPRAMVDEGAVVARPMMYVALSYDHRLVDGKDAVQFLVTIKEFLEDPARMLLEI
jgi:2-oxoglutarate dehydrogenase E2 component (dihydrolipoamide succinyltransferase)